LKRDLTGESDVDLSVNGAGWILTFPVKKNKTANGRDKHTDALYDRSVRNDDVYHRGVFCIHDACGNPNVFCSHDEAVSHVPVYQGQETFHVYGRKAWPSMGIRPGCIAA